MLFCWRNNLLSVVAGGGGGGGYKKRGYRDIEEEKKRKNPQMSQGSLLCKQILPFISQGCYNFWKCGEAICHFQGVKSLKNKQINWGP